MEHACYRCAAFVADAIQKNKEHLTDLDAAIGDGDHGINMARGMAEVMKALPEEEQDLGAVLKKAAMVLLSKVGGASGPLYASGLMKAAPVLAGMEAATPEAFAKALAAAIDGIRARGKATEGEKTMIDALAPAAEAAKEAAGEGQDIEVCLAAAAEAAAAGAEATVPMKATKGRASYLGDRSIGHKDPGAASTAIILEALRVFVRSMKTGG